MTLCLKPLCLHEGLLGINASTWSLRSLWMLFRTDEPLIWVLWVKVTPLINDQPLSFEENDVMKNCPFLWEHFSHSELINLHTPGGEVQLCKPSAKQDGSHVKVWWQWDVTAEFRMNRSSTAAVTSTFSLLSFQLRSSCQSVCLSTRSRLKILTNC